MIKGEIAMTKCDCYHEQTERHYFTDFERRFYVTLCRKGDCTTRIKVYVSKRFFGCVSERKRFS